MAAQFKNQPVSVRTKFLTKSIDFIPAYATSNAPLFTNNMAVIFNDLNDRAIRQAGGNAFTVQILYNDLQDDPVNGPSRDIFYVEPHTNAGSLVPYFTGIELEHALHTGGGKFVGHYGYVGDNEAQDVLREGTRFIVIETVVGAGARNIVDA